MPEFAVPDALAQLVQDASQRRKKTEDFHETIELSLNLNLDPRKPGQALRGSLTLPHGTGKKVNLLVLSDDAAVQAKCQELGVTCGGRQLVQDVKDGNVAVDSYERALATPDVSLSSVARLLGPRGLMPNAKSRTLLSPDELVNILEDQVSGKEVLYRTEKNGIVHIPVGKANMSTEALLENVGSCLQGIHQVKPDAYGKGKKPSKNAKYLLRAHLSTTQGKGSKRLDLRTVDPTSAFFLSSVEAK